MRDDVPANGTGTSGKTAAGAAGAPSSVPTSSLSSLSLMKRTIADTVVEENGAPAGAVAAPGAAVGENATGTAEAALAFTPANSFLPADPECEGEMQLGQTCAFVCKVSVLMLVSVVLVSILICLSGFHFVFNALCTCVTVTTE